MAERLPICSSLGGDLVTMGADRRVVRDGALAVSEGKIAWVGPASEAKGPVPGRAGRCEASGRIVLPGLVDTHFHTGQQLLGARSPSSPRKRQLKLPIWRNYLIPFESVLTEEDMYLSSQIAYANLLRVGTTCFTDAGGPHPDQMARAALELGIRALVAQSTMDMGEGLPASMRFSTKEAIERNVALIKTWGVSATERRVGAWLSLRQLLVCSRELWETFADLADETGSRVHIHLAEGTYEVEYAAEHWGKRPAVYLEHIGFLGPRVHAAHSILLSAEEIDLYVERQVSAAHCPLGNFIIGPPKVPEMHRRGSPSASGPTAPRPGAWTFSRRYGCRSSPCRATTARRGTTVRRSRSRTSGDGDPRRCPGTGAWTITSAASRWASGPTS